MRHQVDKCSFTIFNFLCHFGKKKEKNELKTCKKMLLFNANPQPVDGKTFFIYLAIRFWSNGPASPMDNSLFWVEQEKLVNFIINEKKNVFYSIYCVSLFAGKKLWLHNFVIFLYGIEMFRNDRLDHFQCNKNCVCVTDPSSTSTLDFSRAN